LSLREQIEQEIRERGPIPFSRYMELCLYDPVAGYYSRNAEQFGKAGDFYTASDIHAVFGRLLARHFDQMWRVLGSPPEIELLELGPGRGLFARDVLDWSRKKVPDFFAALHYTPQESSPALRAKLRDRLRDHIDSGKATVPEGPVPDGRPSPILRTRPSTTPLIIFANEFFDAQPVEIVSSEGKLHLALENDRLREVWLRPAAEELKFLDSYGVRPEPGERIEVPLIAQAWITHIAQAISKGFLVIIDYGYTRAEQLSGRHRGTLTAYRHHLASSDPYQSPGEQDLTTTVDWTQIKEAGRCAGLRAIRFERLDQFLASEGLLWHFGEMFTQTRDEVESLRLSTGMRELIRPDGLAASFQVLVQEKGS